jgi:membrane protein DedA with SNARE-associated domain
MADIAQAVVTGGMGIAGVAIGAGLTYWLGALNRRHQEAREDRTRWYEARREAYAALLIAA